jgi:hypothetical protein
LSWKKKSNKRTNSDVIARVTASGTVLMRNFIASASAAAGLVERVEPAAFAPPEFLVVFKFDSGPLKLPGSHKEK